MLGNVCSCSFIKGQDILHRTDDTEHSVSLRTDITVYVSLHRTESTVQTRPLRSEFTVQCCLLDLDIIIRYNSARSVQNFAVQSCCPKLMMMSRCIRYCICIDDSASDGDINQKVLITRSQDDEVQPYLQIYLS